MGEISRRCPHRCATWPDILDYSLCPICGSGTQRFRGLKPVTVEQAESLRKHAEFERYYREKHVPDTDLETLNIDLAGLSE